MKAIECCISVVLCITKEAKLFISVNKILSCSKHFNTKKPITESHITSTR